MQTLGPTQWSTELAQIQRVLSSWISRNLEKVYWFGKSSDGDSAAYICAVNIMEVDNTHRLSAEKLKKTCVINVGSRSSQLALIQTNLVIDKLKKFYDNNPNDDSDHELIFEVVAMSTSGDKILDLPLPKIGTKSLFTKELEIALLAGEVDFIVHSMKDLPTTLPKGCVIGAVMKRDDPNDAIVLKKSLQTEVDPINLLTRMSYGPDGKKLKVGTSSQRRIATVRRHNPNIECIDIRGNLNTRLTKLDNDEGEYAAIILARAGLDRMNWADRASMTLSPDNDSALSDWLYAVGQGAIAVECRADDYKILDLLRPIVDLKTTYEVTAERCLMRKLEGGCSVPLGVRCKWTNENKELHLQSMILSLDGQTVIKENSNIKMSEKRSNVRACERTFAGITLAQSFKDEPDVMNTLASCSELGVEVANKMIDSGGLELMKRSR